MKKKKGIKYISIIAIMGIFIALFAFPASAAARPLHSVQPNGNWILSRSDSTSSKLNNTQGQIWLGGLNNNTTWYQIQSMGAPGFTMIAGKRYIVKANFLFRGNALANGTFLEGRLAIFPERVILSEYQPIRYTGNGADTMELTFDFIANETTNDFYIGFTFNTLTSTVWRESGIDGPILFYDYDEYMRNVPTQEDKDKESLRDRENIESRGGDVDNAKEMTEQAKEEMNAKTKELQSSAGYQWLFGIFGHLVGIFAIPVGIIGTTYLLVILLKKGAS